LKVTRKENWGSRGKVSVTRDERGRFVHWETWVDAIIRMETYGKTISVYGTAINRFGRKSSRYDFSGTGRELEQAVRTAVHMPPKGRFVKVSARDFLMNPGRYGSEGHWSGFKVES
jgi:hypothetical protein